MEILTFKTSPEMGLAAAQYGADAIKHAIAANGAANIILATGASQFEMLKQLVRIPDIHWPAVTAFHLDEYLGLPETHPASFRKYLQERFAAHVPGLKTFYFVNGEHADPRQECARLGEIIQHHPIDVAFVGIGENGHLAFNDPPADFETETPYIVVTLDDACRRQQLGEGWFKTLDEVPQRAISMSIRQILKSRCMIVTVPDRRKARAVHGTVAGDVSNLCPASILQTHPNCTLFLDAEAASLLPEVTGSQEPLQRPQSAEALTTNSEILLYHSMRRFSRCNRLSNVFRILVKAGAPQRLRRLRPKLMLFPVCFCWAKR